MSAITRTGMCCAYRSAASTMSAPETPSALPARPAQISSSSSRQLSRAAGSHLSISLGANAGSSRRRAPAWNGGSDVIGGA